MKTAWIGGGLGFIGHHLARRLKQEGYWVRVVDIKPYEHGEIDFADDVVIGDLRYSRFTQSTLNYGGKWSFYGTPFTEYSNFDIVANLACQMGGAQYVFTGENDADIMHDSALINLNICNALKQQYFKGIVFYSSSACIYPEHIQTKTSNVGLKESDWSPASPDSCYGWEKLFSERLYLAYARNYRLNVRIARFHNIYGPEGTYKGGREKAPAAMCRKVIESSKVLDPSVIGSVARFNFVAGIKSYSEIEVLGDGLQTRSFLYIDDCIDAVRLLMESDFKEPINIGSEEMVSINELAQMAIDISGRDIKIKNVPSNALGVRGRNSDNTLARKVLNGWEPKWHLRAGLEKVFDWILSQYSNGIYTK